MTRGFHAETANQTAVSDYMVALNDAGQLATLYGILDTLDPGDQATLLGQLSGDVHASTMSMAVKNATIYTQFLARQLRPDPLARCCDSSDCSACGYSNGWTGWTLGYGVGGRVFADGNTGGLNTSTGGFLVGMEQQSRSLGKVGMFYNYGNAYNSVGLESVRAENHSFGGYLSAREDVEYCLLTGGFGYDRFDSRRLVAIDGTVESLPALHEGWQSVLYTEYGLDLGFSEHTFQPYLGLQYVYLRQDGFAENSTNGPIGALTVSGTDHNSLRTVLGGRLGRQFALIGRQTSVEFRTAWLHELLDATYPSMNARLSGAASTSTFSTAGADLGRDWCWLGTGLKWNLGGPISLYADYDLMFNGRYSLHTGSGGLTCSW